ncbi:MAG TPA: asparagine synthase (glutamine-hydrolyzing) [Vicinamibacteria bacterium]|nr:asparagine synthase (glutamine-hydrolyzing) [Vicinamibacteria bacterium]
MCGLAGVLNLQGGSLPDQRSLEAVAEALRHRGPDAKGVFVDDGGAPAVALVHRRLSIIDLSHVADQPLGNEDGSVQVALNGEIYNFRELRAELSPLHTFRSQGDSEVIAHLYEDRGLDAIPALDGMFAVVIWDARERRLVLARDPFGKKPFYYWSDGRRLVFASEIKALLAAGVPAEMNEAALGEYLAFGYVPTPDTLFRGIRKLPPASVLVADAAGVHEPRAYWDLSFPAAGETRPVGLDEAKERVLELLTAAVRRRLIADVPLGLLLSGGVDSGAVAALMARLAPGKLKTFTVGFEGALAYDEREPAARVARHVGSEHHASVVEAHAAGLVETLLHHHDEPFGDSSALPTYLVAREARRHVTVAINGDGGDETFAGYERFHAAVLADRIPRPMRGALRAAARLLPEGADYLGTLRRIRRFTDKATRPFDERIFGWTSFFDLPEIAALDADAVFDPERVLGSYRRALARCASASPLSRLLYLNARTYLLDDLLPKMDRMTMAHALEARSPFLDRALVEYVASLPDGLKRRGARGKVVLRAAIADLVPGEILERPKHGFGVPLGAWFRGELRPMVEDTLLSQPRLGRRLKLDHIRRMFADHLAGRVDRGHQLWTLLTLELWLRKHGFE